MCSESDILTLIGGAIFPPRFDKLQLEKPSVADCKMSLTTVDSRVYLATMLPRQKSWDPVNMAGLHWASFRQHLLSTQPAPATI